ncbi:MAG: MarR family transcriptional regulator [Clostridiales bacterium]
MNIPTREYLFGSIFLLANKLQALGDAMLEEVSLKQWLLLAMIFNMDTKQPSVTEIAEFIGSSRQNVRKMLEVLCAKGYVTLGVNEQDKRNLSVTLTEKTFQFFGRFEAKGAAFLEQLFDGVGSPQQESARITVEALFDNLERMKIQYGKNDSRL